MIAFYVSFAAVTFGLVLLLAMCIVALADWCEGN